MQIYDVHLTVSTFRKRFSLQAKKSSFQCQCILGMDWEIVIDHHNMFHKAQAFHIPPAPTGRAYRFSAHI